MSSLMLTIQNLSVKVGDKTIISDFSYTFEKGRTYVIMGPNGSGKSTLAHAIMGNPTYTSQFSILNFQNSEGDAFELKRMSADQRARAGIYLSFQAPPVISGVRPAQLLQASLGKAISAVDLRKRIKSIAQELHIPEDLLNRGINEGASGGERKKLEVLQAGILDRPLQIFDEIDTGVDVDAISDIGTFLHTRKLGKTYIVITHSNRILHLLQPDKVLVMDSGRLKLTGDKSLVQKIEREGFTNL